MSAQSSKTNKQHDGNGDDAQVHLNNRKRRLKWTIGLHECFLKAVHQLGGPYKATPKQIQKLMDVQEVNSDHIKSHLQKHRMRIDQSLRAKTKAAGKAPSIWIPEENEDTYIRSTLISRQANEDIQNIKAQRPTVEVSTKFNVESKNFGNVKQQQLEVKAHKTHLLWRSDTEAKYDNVQSAPSYDMCIPDTNSNMSLAETKVRHISLCSSSGDANAVKTTTEQKMCDGLTISSCSNFSKGGPKTRVEDLIHVPRMTASHSHLPFDLNVSTQDE